MFDEIMALAAAEGVRPRPRRGVGPRHGHLRGGRSRTSRRWPPTWPPAGAARSTRSASRSRGGGPDTACPPRPTTSSGGSSSPGRRSEGCDERRAARANRITIDRAIPVTTRDGVLLATDVYRPDAPGPFPTLVYRVRGGRSSAFIAGVLLLNPLDAVERGYAVVIQEVRGRAGSQDRWHPFVHERDDSEDCLDWVVAQPWCDGRTGRLRHGLLGGRGDCRWRRWAGTSSRRRRARHRRRLPRRLDLHVGRLRAGLERLLGVHDPERVDRPPRRRRRHPGRAQGPPRRGDHRGPGHGGAAAAARPPAAHRGRRHPVPRVARPPRLRRLLGRRRPARRGSSGSRRRCCRSSVGGTTSCRRTSTCTGR